MIGSGGHYVLSKLFKLNDHPNPADQSGFEAIGFGKGKLLELDNKISTDETLEMVMNGLADHVPKSSFKVPGQVSLEPYFKGDAHFMIYEGSKTFEECSPATWLVSLTTGVVRNVVLADFDQSAKCDFLARPSGGFAVVYQNRDPPKASNQPLTPPTPSNQNP